MNMWILKFKDGKMGIKYDYRLGRPRTTNEMIVQIQKRVNEDGRWSINGHTYS